LRYIIFLLLIFSFSAYSSEILKYQFESIIRDINNENDTKVGIFIKSLSEDGFAFMYNYRDPFIPASNQKLITTVSAIANLSPDFKYKTILATDGNVKNGTLYGNLYLIGGGDPSLAVQDLENIVKKLKEYGISRVEGNLIGDNSYFSEEGTGQGWPEDDLNYCFTARFSGLSVNENCLRISVNIKNGKVYVSMNPLNNYYQIVNNIEFSKKAGNVILRVEGNKLILEGKVSSKRSLNLEFSIPVNHPSIFTLSVLSKILDENGIKVSGKMYLGKATSYKCFVIHQSKPLRELIKKANKDSNNFYAEQIFRTIGKEVYGEGSTYASARAIIDTLRKMHVATENIRIYDGSGLSKYNYTTPEALVKVLDYIYKTPYFYDFFESLAISGVDGTLKHRLNDQFLKGRIIAKTGYIKKVKNLSGYVKASNGEVFVFSILVNDLKTTEIANKLQEKICSILAQYPRMVGIGNLNTNNKIR
jgi:D-alanyl-D-alanine carboxypeptidase/D-alanyl-D-alanine-endopeptidase (penicillin-binding protein 4)